MPELNGKRLRINSADVAFEVIEGEVIAIDFSRGSYYNLAGGGVSIWEMLGAGATADEITTRFAADDEQRSEIEAFLERLLGEALVIAEEGSDVSADARESAVLTSEAPKGFTTPRFEKYDDMEDYFVLDPIHDVDAKGWPNPSSG